MPGSVPVPESGTFVGLALTLLAIDSVPFLGPIWVGAKTTWITHVPLAATESVQSDQSTSVKSPLPVTA